jgi:hypothetical protein
MEAKPERRRRVLRPVPETETDTFSKWLRHQTNQAKAALGALVTIPGLTLVLGLLARQYIPQVRPHIESIVVVVLFIQFLAIFCLYWFIPRHPEVEQSAEAAQGEVLPRAARAAKRFENFWGYAWLCWAVVYFGLGLSLQYKLWYPSANLWFKDPLNVFLNNVQTVFFLMCYRELRYPTDEEQRNPLFALLSIPVFLMVIESVLLAPDNPAQASTGVPLSNFLGWTSGFAAGAAIALLVGRLESKLIDPPLWVIALLYLYAAIQGAHRILTVDLYATLVLTSLAFFSKLIFFLLIAWLLQSGVLMYYLVEITKAHDRVPKERRSFVARLARRVRT